ADQIEAVMRLKAVDLNPPETLAVKHRAGQDRTEETAKWRDQILLDEAKNRAENLTKGVRPFNEPNNYAERQYVIPKPLAGEASARGDDLAAVRLWREMAQRLKAQGEGHRDTATSDSNLAATPLARGKAAEAEAMLRLALAMTEALYPKERYP